MKPRKPLPRSTKPLPRSTKPLKRTPITRKPTKRKTEIDRKLKAAKVFYFKEYGYGDGTAPCQDCRDVLKPTQAHAHHKIKRSLWATASAWERAWCGDPHSLKNLVVICRKCHRWIHAKPERLDAIRKHEGNAENGVKLNDLHYLYTETA